MMDENVAKIIALTPDDRQDITDIAKQIIDILAEKYDFNTPRGAYISVQTLAAAFASFVATRYDNRQEVVDGIVKLISNKVRMAFILVDENENT